jgi:hypothetical protein
VIIPRAGRPLDIAFERGAYTGGEYRHIDHVVVAEQGYRQLAVVGKCSHGEPYTGDERGERHSLKQPRTSTVERRRWTRDVGDIRLDVTGCGPPSQNHTQPRQADGQHDDPGNSLIWTVFAY